MPFLALMTRFSTLGSGLFRRFWYPVSSEEDSIIFSVKSCGDVRVALSEVPYNLYTNAYEVVIGRLLDMFSTIKDKINGREMEVKYTPGILNCTEIRTFWVSWQNGTISFGQGSYVGLQHILSWSPPQPHSINAVALTTNAGRQANFEVVHIGGKYSTN